MHTAFGHTFRADLMKSNIFRYEQDANECSKMLQRSNFLDRTTSKALPTTRTIITRSIVERSKTAVTKKIASTTLPQASVSRRAMNARYNYIPASELPADGSD